MFHSKRFLNFLVKLNVSKIQFPPLLVRDIRTSHLIDMGLAWAIRLFMFSNSQRMSYCQIKMLSLCCNLVIICNYTGYLHSNLYVLILSFILISNNHMWISRFHRLNEKTFFSLLSETRNYFSKIFIHALKRPNIHIKFMKEIRR